MDIEKREIRKRVYIVCCPTCGKFQYRVWGDGGIAFQCDRCKASVEAIFMNGQITMRDDTDYENGYVKMKCAVNMAN